MLMCNKCGQCASTGWVPSLPEVLSATGSLYDDELKPFGRVVLKRLRERAAAELAKTLGLDPDTVDVATIPRIDPKRLRSICENCKLLCVHLESGREYSVTFVDRPFNFLDICSTHDPYPEELWDKMSAYFEGLGPNDIRLPNGRYACAMALLKRNLPFLKETSLGQVCHIVQLAITQRRILGYRDGQVVPFMHSEEWVKGQYALSQSKFGTGALPVASWEDARVCLLELLSFKSGRGLISISNVKRLFRSRFQLELSETVLGYTRLFDLLKDPRFADVCCVHTQRNGQVMVGKVQVPRPPGMTAAPGSWYMSGQVSVPRMLPTEADADLSEDDFMPISAKAEEVLKEVLCDETQDETQEQETCVESDGEGPKPSVGALEKDSEEEGIGQGQSAVSEEGSVAKDVEADADPALQLGAKESSLSDVRGGQPPMPRFVKRMAKDTSASRKASMEWTPHVDWSWRPVSRQDQWWGSPEQYGNPSTNGWYTAWGPSTGWENWGGGWSAPWQPSHKNQHQYYSKKSQGEDHHPATGAGGHPESGPPGVWQKTASHVENATD